MYIERVAAGADVTAEPLAPVRTLTTDDEAELDPYEARFGPDPTQTVEWTRGRAFLARPQLVQTGRRTRPHGLPWLPQAVQVNDHEFEVYVESAWPAARAAASGVPSARMFLVGHLDPSPTPDRHEVRIRVARHAAVDVPASGGAPPALLRAEVSANDAYVLPAAWLDRCQIVLDDESGASVPAAMWCSGAGHGVDGLPDTEHGWPRALRGSTRAYARLPEPDTDTAMGWVSLYRGLPRGANGRLVEMMVGNGRAIDLVKLEAQLEALPAVRTIVPDLRAQGVRLILPSGEFERTLATRVFEAEGGRWRPRPVRRDLTLADLIANGEPPSDAG
jgi:hypothetical protein